ncbi:uncharacterized protein N7482_003991 [Penicillium canariense]|uniref:Isochorismatase-like domain-containing protein n=1 Tax=Penicillium canariense TaxID=189055 RepID=A0A9W9I9M3_9EURO|nr:uncharacterized protein N7482_003991 [Penicillium canariense]KAJ5168397.1 hypothetical protein N7482_003991 [Penicillium canariense]
MARTALFVIDIQADLAQNPRTEIPYAARIRDVGAAVLSKARIAIDNELGRGLGANLSIIIVQHHETPENGSLVRGSKPWELVFKPRNETERIVEKTTRDTFESNQQLADQLKAEGIEEIVAIGIQSECCVQSTCEGALAAGFKVVLLQGAHSTYDMGSRKAEEIEREVEEKLRKEGAEIIPWDTWQP